MDSGTAARGTASLVLLVVLVASPALAQDYVSLKVTQPNSPLQITKYEAKYHRNDNEIQHRIEYINVDTREVVASQFAFGSFNVFNQGLALTKGTDMDDVLSGETKKGLWTARRSGAFSFLTGIAYVYKVRFRDGEIWTADMAAVTAELVELLAGAEGFDLGQFEDSDE